VRLAFALSSLSLSVLEHVLTPCSHARRLFDLRNQVSLDEKKLSRIAEYEHRIEALTKTLAIWCVPFLPRSLFGLVPP